MIKQVIFDLGRVLLKWEPELLAQRLSEEHSDFDYNVWTITQEPSWLDFDMGLIRTPELVARYENKFSRASLELFMKKVPHILTPQPEGLRLLEATNERGLKKYVLSNMSHDFYEHLIASYPFLGEFDGSVYSCHYNLAKPDTELFRMILDKFGLVPSETLFVDDMPYNVEAARSLGMEALVFTKDDDTYRQFLSKIENI
jgi:putative hydrolase of the HAD superfamily